MGQSASGYLALWRTWHSGDLYAIFMVSDEAINVYNDLLEKEKIRVSDIEMAKRLATTALMNVNEKAGSKKKLIDVRRL